VRFPPEARTKPVLIVSRISHTESAAAVDRQVREFLDRGESLYSVDLAALGAIEPDLIITQDLCHVCAATPDDLGAALAHLPRQAQIVTLNPHSLADVCADIRAVARATGRSEQASAVIAEFEREVAQVERAVAGLSRPRWRVSNGSIRHTSRATGCRRWWREPAGSMRWATLANHHSASSGETIFASQPDVIVIMPCGYGLNQVAKEFRDMALPEGWTTCPRYGMGRVFLVEASGYFSRPGPRLAAGVAILADAVHDGQQASLTSARRRVGSRTCRQPRETDGGVTN